MDERRYSSVDQQHLSLVDTLDRVLNKGVVVLGEVVISVADIDLVCLELQLVLASVDTFRRTRSESIARLTTRHEVSHE